MIKRLLALLLCAVMMLPCFLMGCNHEGDTQPDSTNTEGTTGADVTTAPDTEPSSEATTSPSTDNGSNTEPDGGGRRSRREPHRVR